VPAQEKCRGAGLPGGGIEPARLLQAKRARLAQNRSQRAGMQSFLHDAQDLSIFRAFDPNDAGRIKAQAGQPRRIAIGPACRPEEKAIVLAQNFRRNYCRKGCHGGRKFALKPLSTKLMERAKLKAASWQGSVQPLACKRQNPPRHFQTMAFEGADLQP